MRVSTMVTDELGSVPPTALVKATRQRILWTPANEYDITAAVERERWRRSRGIAQELEPNRGSSK
jgi:UTP:GlnB (protein PII) uridylyltransferase